MVQNSLPTAIPKTLIYQQIMPVLLSLHQQWTKNLFQICLTVHQILHINQPTYIFCSILITPHSKRYCTPSMDTVTAAVPYSHTMFGSQAFSVAGPKLWNSLPISDYSVNSFMSFSSKLKTHLSQLAHTYHSLVSLTYRISTWFF